MTSVNGYSNYSQSGMYIPSYMQTPGTTTTTTNTTTTTTSEKKGGVGMGTVLLAGAVILGGIITFKNGGLKNTFKQIGKLFGKNADDAAKNLNLLEKGKALIKGTNAKKGTDAVGEALTEAATRTGKKRWFSDDIIDIAKKPDVRETAQKAATENGEKAVRELTDRESAIQTRIDNIKKNLPDNASDGLKQNLQYRENTMKNIRNIDDLTDEQRESILSNLEKQLDGIEQTAKIPTVANTAKKAATENGEKAVRELTDRESAIQTRIDNIKKNLPDNASDGLKQNLQYRENTMKNIRNIDDLTADQQENILKNLETQLDGIEDRVKVQQTLAEMDLEDQMQYIHDSAR